MRALLVVFSCANTHRGRYLAPAHPVLAAALAPFLLGCARSREGARALHGLGLLLAFVLGLVGVLVARVDLAIGAGILTAPAGYLLGAARVRGGELGLGGAGAAPCSRSSRSVRAA
ncbi:MAG: hypothetical protein U0802_11935 [Candidatus Binatia bacterium]